MPAEFWYPISGATHDLPAGHDDWANNGGANKNASTQVGGGRAGPATHDDDTSYISRAAGAGVGEQALNVSWPGPIESLGTGTFFTGGGRHRTTGTTQRLVRFINAAATYGAAFVNINDSNTSYVTTGPVDVSVGATYKPGGASWAVSDFATEQTIFAQCDTQSLAAGESRVTSVFGQLTYNPPQGGFVFLLQLAGLGALPFVGHLADFAQFSRYLSWRRVHHRRHTLLTPDETRQAWRELRAYRHPRFFLPAVA